MEYFLYALYFYLFLVLVKIVKHYAKKFNITFNKFSIFLYTILILTFFISIGMYYFLETSSYQFTKKVDNSKISLTKKKWSPVQSKNLLLIQEACDSIKHPSPKRMGAHLLNESTGNTVVDGDVNNGAFKKSYGVMQVKLDTVYYVKNKRPDLIKLHVPEVNTLPKEEVLEKLRKDPYFNIKMGVLTHLTLIGVCKDDMDKASVAYNRGKCETDKLGQEYLDRIKRNENLL